MLLRRNNINLDDERYQGRFLNTPPWKFTKPSSESSDFSELDLPVDPEFHALPPHLTLPEYCRANQEFRKMFPKGIPSEEERLARKVSAIFEF